jgi:hypothetical protein
MELTDVVVVAAHLEDLMEQQTQLLELVVQE